RRFEAFALAPPGGRVILVDSDSTGVVDCIRLWTETAFHLGPAPTTIRSRQPLPALIREGPSRIFRSLIMRVSPLTLAGVALTFLLVGHQTARADFIPWNYNWSRSPSEIHADAPGTGHIALTDESLKTAVGSSDIVATN